ncbi:MAG: glycosyltransferase, partial [Actinobacteria bacterium]|nr:glycosyltransferase [Actinomycetota bacterium]
ANSEYTAEELRRSLWDRSDDFIHVTPMGVDASAFGPVHRDRELRRYLLSQAGGDNDSVLLVYAGRLSPEKHPHLLIDALACLVNRRHRLGGALDFRLVLAGDGPALPGILADAARRTPNRVHAMGVVRDRGALARLYASCDVFVHPNPREPFGILPDEREETIVKLDTHVHTTHSGSATVFLFNHFMRECYNTPDSVYATAQKRGMDLVIITDHDEISGALALGERDDVLVGCEVTAEWPDIDLCVHINVFDITPAQHAEIQRLRTDVRGLMPYLRQQNIYSSLNHVASGINGPLTAAHLSSVLPWVDGLEVINGTRQPSQNRTAMCLAAAAGKHTLGGSDSHTGRGIGLTWTEVPGATT